MDQVTFVKDTLKWLKFFKGCLPQILLGLLLNSLAHLWPFQVKKPLNIFPNNLYLIDDSCDQEVIIKHSWCIFPVI